MANQLKLDIDQLISPIQSAFLKGQLISDNILVAYELFLHMSNHKGCKPLMDLKLDMSKAYDHVKWTFLLAMLQKMGFSNQWCNWISRCISSPNF